MNCPMKYAFRREKVFILKDCLDLVCQECIIMQNLDYKGDMKNIKFKCNHCGVISGFGKSFMTKGQAKRI